MLCAKFNEASGKKAISFINERLMAEAKSLIQYTGLDIAEIAYRLIFSDLALEFRKSKIELS